MYNTVLPSSLLQYADDSYYSALSNSINNTALRIGVVKTVHYANNKINLEKNAPEYDVLVFQQDKDKGVIPITYRNCVTMDAFGGIGDFFEYVKSQPTNPTSTKLDIDDGSYVLLLCIDGTATRGVILGALPHHNRKTTLPKDKAKHLEGEYNGLRIKINDDGELTLTFKGKTDTKGKPTTTVGGSQIKMEKDGSVELNDRDLDGQLKSGNDLKANDTSVAPADYDKIRIDKTKQSISINARKDYTQTIGGKADITIKGNMTQKMAELLVEASGKANVKTGGALDIIAGANLNLNAVSAKFKFDSSFEVKAGTMKFSAEAIVLGEGATPALVLNTQFIGIGNLSVPIISTAIGPFSSKVFIAS